MKGWFRDRYRHSLAAMGIRTSLSARGLSLSVKNPTQNEMNVMRLLGEGRDQMSIAKELNLSQPSVSRIKRAFRGEASSGLKSYPQAKMIPLDFQKGGLTKEEQKMINQDQKLALRELKKELQIEDLAPLPVRTTPIPKMNVITSPLKEDIPNIDWDSYNFLRNKEWEKKYEFKNLRELRRALKKGDISDAEANVIKSVIDKKIQKIREAKAVADLMPSPFEEDQIMPSGYSEEQEGEEVMDYEDQESFKNKGF